MSRSRRHELSTLPQGRRCCAVEEMNVERSSSFDFAEEPFHHVVHHCLLLVEEEE